MNGKLFRCSHSVTLISLIRQSCDAGIHSTVLTMHELLQMNDEQHSAL